MKKISIAAILLFITILGVVFYFQSNIFKTSSKPGVSISTTTGVTEPSDLLQKQEESGADIETVVSDLQIPWEIAFLPNGEMLVTERPGRVLRIGKDRQVYEIPGVRHLGEGGLLGMALHPDFSNNNFIYLYLTSEEQGQIVNRVESYTLQDDRLAERKLILSGIKGARNHDGGRIEFGPDGYLYITTGDAQTPSLSQDISSLNGKILRINDDGSVPEDNPFSNEIYSWGHRNPQGLAWDSEGRLWATEHGRSGVLSGLDELNLIEKGKNYGWPEIQGDEVQEGMIPPVLHSGSSETWAPAGAEIVNSSIFFVGLRGASLYQAELSGITVQNLKRHFEDEYGRLRVVRLGADGYIYLATSNRDGRGRARKGDDKIIRIHPKIFK